MEHSPVGFLRKLFSSDGYLPHGHCYLWQPGLIWTHVISDGFIALAYTSIPLTLLYLIRKRKDLPFNWMVLSFGAFIVACGATHVMAIWTLWNATYWLSALVKIVTALASVSTAIALVQLVPTLLSIPSIEQLQIANRNLEKTEKQQADLIKKLEAANQELNDFASVVSHDLKAPLRAIGSLTHWLLTDYADKFDEAGREQVKLLMGRVNRMENLINGILEYSKVGRIKEEKTMVNLERLLKDVIDMLSPLSSVEIRFDTKLPILLIEATKITQVFQNLLSNALKFMDKQERTIKIGCVDERSHWKIYVSDNGRGIDKKYFEKIFEMFQTLSSRDKIEGTGVGLSVVKKIIEGSGGTIWVESQVGQGSTFYFTVPK